VAKEIEDKLEDLGRDGYRITKISVVGYSLGGLVARYAIGLLYHKGYFEKIKPMTFTTFATPHLGVRTPSKGYPNHLWNVLGARTLSTSGRQLFTIDDFRDTGRPILDVMTDPNSVFIHALAQFERRTLYCNIVNDRSAVYYTTGISRIDPYTNLDGLTLNHVPGYEPVVLDPSNPFTPVREHESLPTFYSRFTSKSSSLFRRLPIYIALTVILPIASFVFLINSGFQTFQSRRRIMLHHTSPSNPFGSYRIPYFVQDMRAGLEDAFENVNSAQQQEYLDDGTEELASPMPDTTSPPSAPLLTSNPHHHAKTESTTSLLSEKADPDSNTITNTNPTLSPQLTRTTSLTTNQLFPTLALTPAQFRMIQSLDEVGWRKYPVHITQSSHSHAAIIVRIPSRKAFREGKVVVRHWLEREFLL
jgi:hypothetical protein